MTRAPTSALWESLRSHVLGTSPKRSSDDSAQELELILQQMGRP